MSDTPLPVWIAERNLFGSTWADRLRAEVVAAAASWRVAGTGEDRKVSEHRSGYELEVPAWARRSLLFYVGGRVEDVARRFGWREGDEPRYEIACAAYHHGHYYAPHTDSGVELSGGSVHLDRRLSWSYYFMADPCMYEGGALLFPHQQTLFRPERDCLVWTHSDTMRAVDVVSVRPGQHKNPEAALFEVSGWISWTPNESD